jgi:hypothetical protein
MTTQIISIEELVALNEMMLGRGMPVQEDGIGYNKADYGACANYFYGLSDAQVADLSKRLIKYTQTQLGIDKQIMKDTHEYYKAIVEDGDDRVDGVSVNVTENGTLISFRYNEAFISKVKEQPKRQYDAENKQWVVPNHNAIATLEALRDIGADVDNAVEYVKNHELCTKKEEEKIDVLAKYDGDFVLLKFDYNKDIVNEVKKIDYKDRKWNPDFKFWAVKQNHLDNLVKSLSNVANFIIA